ncbi:MAG: patatin-like phospholipase family protein [Acetobacter sp.]|nr:patatin-like phospholipase family protein [Bacteroides sp.]MCM1341853.1 patatin-like phospholipase family protein [Acetobacter sp.]MCM1434019.1 patatin-like phospholipase family protein [Clostridiales bacterium]
MTHFFNLNKEPFEKIAENKKNIELRLFDEKRQKVNIGDKIIFTCKEDNNNILSVIVTDLHKFESFEELYKNLDLTKCGYSHEEIGSACAKDMEKYYTKSQIKKYGVLGIEFRKAMPNDNFNCGLVLEGGGIRALYSSGVLDAFLENNIEFPYVIGVSAGSCNGVSFLGKNINRMKNITIEYSCDEKYKSIKSLFKNGEYLNSKWIFGELTYDIYPLDYDAYDKSNAVLCAVTTNAKTGRPEYFYPKDFRNECEVLRASCALPIATNPVPLGKDVYYDGGITDSIPLKKAFDDGCKKCVVILTQDKTYVKKPMGHERVICKILKKYPLTAEKVLTRHIMYNKQREYVFEQENLGNALVICPPKPLNCSTLNVTTEQQKEIYDIGYKQGLEYIDRVKEFLK